MKIVEADESEKIITRVAAEKYLEKNINNQVKNNLYIIMYKGEIISLSGTYYKFAWKKIGYLKNALSNKFGKELADALVKDKVIEIYRIVI